MRNVCARHASLHVPSRSLLVAGCDVTISIWHGHRRQPTKMMREHVRLFLILFYETVTYAKWNDDTLKSVFGFRQNIGNRQVIVARIHCNKFNDFISKIIDNGQRPSFTSRNAIITLQHEQNEFVEFGILWFWFGHTWSTPIYVHALCAARIFKSLHKL